MKKIAVIFPKDSEAMFNKNNKRTFGGATVQMYLIAKELNNYKNINTYSFIPNYKKISFDEKNKFNLIKIYSEKDNLLTKVFKLHKKIKEIKPDIIIQHGLTLESCFLAKYCKLNKIKFVFMFAHDVKIKGMYQSSQKKCWLFKTLLKNSYKLIVENKFQTERLLKLYKKIGTIMYNGFKIPEKCSKEKKFVLWVGRNDKWKNPKLLIKLARQNPKIKFIMICSKTKDINYFKEIKEQAKKIKNLEFIDFVPFNKINNYFKQGYIFLNTSDYEGFPQTFIQSTMYTSPILSLNVNPEEFITKNKCGFVCKGNLNLMNKNLNKLMDNKKLYQKMSDNSFNYAKENHNVKKNVKKLLEEIK
jgi:glycosyltransferase involved in cell wall biosynthesis